MGPSNLAITSVSWSDRTSHSPTATISYYVSSSNLVCLSLTYLLLLGLLVITRITNLSITSVSWSDWSSHSPTATISSHWWRDILLHVYLWSIESELIHLAWVQLKFSIKETYGWLPKLLDIHLSFSHSLLEYSNLYLENLISPFNSFRRAFSTCFWQEKWHRNCVLLA